MTLLGKDHNKEKMTLSNKAYHRSLKQEPLKHESGPWFRCQVKLSSIFCHESGVFSFLFLIEGLLRRQCKGQTATICYNFLSSRLILGGKQHLYSQKFSWQGAPNSLLQSEKGVHGECFVDQHKTSFFIVRSDQHSAAIHESGKYKPNLSQASFLHISSLTIKYFLVAG